MPRQRPTFAFSLDKGLMAEIDDLRGMVPRSTYVEHLLNTALNGEIDVSHRANYQH